jgi:SAM domain (Sterile alpha motif)
LVSATAATAAHSYCHTPLTLAEVRALLDRTFMDVGGWLRSLGLEQYEATFRENAINEKVLPNLTAEDLKDLGIGIVGHRRKLLNAISALRADAKAPHLHLNHCYFIQFSWTASALCSPLCSERLWMD